MTKQLVSLVGTLLLAGALGATTTAYAQRGPGMGQRMYDPSTVETVTGVVTAVDTVTGRRGRQHRGIHVRMTGAGESLTVHLGPLFYLQQQKVRLQAGDSLTVRGSRVAMRGEPSVIAAELTRQDQTWTLRDEQGFPRWRGQRRQN
jgi:hypothetical protein